MSFFFNEAKSAPRKPAAAAKRKDIPIASLNRLGCGVCPRDQDESKLRSPKMKPSGAAAPLVYLLGSAPSQEDDDEDTHFFDQAGEEVVRKFGRFFEKHVRCGHITQCLPRSEQTQRADQIVAATECCRNRVVADIEATQPLVVVGIGDAPLKWATNLGMNALRIRGTLIACKFGSHVCWYYPIIYPNYVYKKKKFGVSEYELAVKHDIEQLIRMVEQDDFEAPPFHDAPYDKGIEYITGQEPGDMQRLEKALAELALFPEVAVDVETADGATGLGITRPYSVKDPRIQTCAIGTFEHTVAFTLDHPEGWGTEVQRKKAWSLLGEFLLNSGRKQAHHLAMEQEWFAYFFGPQLLRLTEWDDTMAMTHTFDERPGTKGLDVQTRIQFGFFLKEQSRVDPVRLLDYPLKEALRYNGMDTKWTNLLARVYKKKLLRARPEDRWEYERKVRLCPTLILTEAKGLPCDMDYALAQEKTLSAEMELIEEKIRKCPEVKDFSRRFGSFSVTNPDHALKLMRDICKRDEIRREDRDGSVSWTSDEEALNSIPKSEVPSASLILEHRAAAKLLSTYVIPITTKRIVNPDGMIRTKYGSMVAVTGRLNSEDPNLQNFPKRKRKEVRGVVYAENGQWILACDYGQIEFRVVGMASEDPNLVKYCWTGYDVHKYWAERMVKKYPKIKDHIIAEFDLKDWEQDGKGIKTLRQESKNKWVFPQLFGSSARSCAANLHIPEDIADDLAGEFWDEFRYVKKWQEKLITNYEKNLYVETLTGRRRRGPQTKNELINHPIQGTAADIVLEGMCAVSERAQMEDDWFLHPNLNVHDDLSYWQPDEGLERRLDIIVTEMCRPRFSFVNVPLIVEASIGTRWHELKEIGVYRSNELFSIPNPYA